MTTTKSLLSKLWKLEKDAQEIRQGHEESKRNKRDIESVKLLKSLYLKDVEQFD